VPVGSVGKDFLIRAVAASVAPIVETFNAVTGRGPHRVN
jgi:hypothetical protein